MIIIESHISAVAMIDVQGKQVANVKKSSNNYEVINLKFTFYELQLDLLLMEN